MRFPRPSFPVIGALLLVVTSLAWAVKPKGNSAEQAFQVDTTRKGPGSCIAQSQCTGRGLIGECSKFSLENAQESARDRVNECIGEMKKECAKVGGTFEALPHGPFEFVDDSASSRGTAIVISRDYSCNACGKK